MKLITDYNLAGAIKNVNEPYTPLKMLRNEKRFMLYFHLPLCMTMNLIKGDFLYALKTYPLNFLAFTALYPVVEISLSRARFGTIDRYKHKSEEDLEKLVPELRKIDVDTNYDLLLKSRCLKTKYHFYLNDHTIPLLMESKYFFVPTNEVDSVTGSVVLQEHTIGAIKYYLSKAPTQKAEELLKDSQKRINLSLRRV